MLPFAVALENGHVLITMGRLDDSAMTVSIKNVATIAKTNFLLSIFRPPFNNNLTFAKMKRNQG